MPGTAASYAFAYTYNLADGMLEMTYPGGRKVSYDYYNSGRVKLARNGSALSSLRWVNGDISYWPSGAAKSMTLGKTTGLDDRLRVNGRKAAKTGVNLMTLTVSYGGYDGANRLGSATQPRRSSLRIPTRKR